MVDYKDTIAYKVAVDTLANTVIDTGLMNIKDKELEIYIFHCIFLVNFY